MIEKTDELLTKEEKKAIKGELNRYRDYNKNTSVKTRLRDVPTNRTAQLFGINHFPCSAFGKQLVLKIIDELLDEGEGGEEDGY